ncbi:MAG TPA: polysaccharide biosynthesis/export family protein [Candidatus Dormibacteraeota bacterium]|nr:polysaccharide biosynthesis/export family protein [Candidatus Dormibacteraeota bacterium]
MAFLVAGMLLTCRPVALRAQDQRLAQPEARVRKPSSARQTASTGEALPLPGYTIAPGDLLDVYVVAVPELSRRYRVGPSGRITLPMLDHPIQAQGLTPDQLSEAIGQGLHRQGLITHPDVLVSVESSPRNSIVVTGSVARPGVYPAYGPTRIVAILSLAGGLSPDAGSTAIVMRGAKAMQWLEASDAPGAGNDPSRPPRIVKVPIRHLLDTGDEPQNLALYPGDEVDVPRAGVVYVVGAVHRAGGFALTGEASELTVLQAIALAGNVTRTAMLKNAMIIRQNPARSAGRKQIRVNLKEILAGKASDRSLSPGDFLFVPDSTGKQVLARALAAATSVAIYRAPL